MKPSELRIGNYVMDSVSKELMVISELNENIGATVIDRSKFPFTHKWQMAPIPLNAEILEQWGFKEREPNWFVLQPELQNIEYRLKWLEGWLEGWLFFRGFGDKWNDEIANIKFLHQLQNLYFSLTGKELEFKPAFTYTPSQ